MATIDWDGFDLGRLTDALRGLRNAPDGEKTIWAFEEALKVARLDEGLLDYLLVAVTCLLARRSEVAPREVLDAFFRRSVSDDEWRSTYLPLFT